MNRLVVGIFYGCYFMEDTHATQPLMFLTQTYP